MCSLFACALAVLAAGPAAGSTLAFLQLLLGPANAALPSRLLLRIFDPADELVAGQWRDVVPGIESRGVADQRLAQVTRKFVYHTTGHPLAAHAPHGSGSAPRRRRVDKNGASAGRDLNPRITALQAAPLGRSGTDA
jgi:hypothetical protein